ncbi:DUF2490 domain-containing protein [Flavimarina sp. Hel_I_48]|uniref:DUF2490 domain-containing protein n=1 Tax=Flavimarina sp. Hel_I_48 TaxID=1392488 RepID=UPI0004DEF6C5|nr:DUF2490 domain-containing protein [Flavimarina sp. Hel_I_48]
MKYSFTTCALIASLFLATVHTSIAQETEGKLGGWYAYVFNTKFGDSQFGAMGDFQYRLHGLGNDFQQLILRGGLTYRPKDSGITLLAGYSYFSSGVLGDVESTFSEHRPYQDALLSQQVWGNVFVVHRFRLEERFVEDQDFRTRFRYMVSARLPLNQKTLTKDAFFLVALNEVFINGQKDIGNDRNVTLFDRNWLAGGIGYAFTDKLRLEATYMRESTESRNKGQLWFTLFHTL